MAQVTLQSEDEARGLPEGDGQEILELDGLPGAFTLHFQPEFDLQTGAVRSCEALLRWLHPDFGVLRPNAALQATRWSEALSDLEGWALGAAFRQAATWSRTTTPITVAANVSMRQVRDDAFVERVAEAIDAAGVDPAIVAVDVPFQAFTRRPRPTAVAVAELDRMGLTVVADDVTGDVRQAELDACPLAVYKILLYPTSHRRSTLHPSAVTALELAHEAGAVAVAKAVENSAELEVLSSLGFDRAFGHVYSPALPPEQLVALLDGD